MSVYRAGAALSRANFAGVECPCVGMRRVFFEAGKTLSFMLSILSLYPMIVSAFFVPGTHWEERLSMAVLRVALAACVCLASGLLFAYSPGRRNEPLLQTLPVRMFLWTLAGAAVFFVISWYLEAYYVPLLWRNQPREIGAIAGRWALPGECSSCARYAG